jgi:hypothetical protein
MAPGEAETTKLEKTIYFSTDQSGQGSNKACPTLSSMSAMVVIKGTYDESLNNFLLCPAKAGPIISSV